MESPYRHGIAFIEGRYCPIEEARISILDLGFLRSDANQDTVSVWAGSFFRLDDHQQRFERNNARLRLNCPYERAERSEILAECVRRTGLSNAYVQMVMTRGRPPVGVRDIRKCDNQFYAFCRNCSGWRAGFEAGWDHRAAFEDRNQSIDHAQAVLADRGDIGSGPAERLGAVPAAERA